MTIEERFYEETGNMPFQPDYKDKLIDWMKIELQRISDTPILSAVPSEEIKEFNCRWNRLPEITKKIGKGNIINIQRMYPDDDIYYVYYWAKV